MKDIKNLSQEELNKLVDDYIDAEDISEFDLDYLENDYDFMTRVIMKSNDKNFYDLCSNNLKGNFNFIKFLFTKFKSDKKYIDKILVEYFNFCNKKSKLNYNIVTFLIKNITDKSKLRTITDYFINNSEDAVLKLELMSLLANDHDNFLDYAVKLNAQILAEMVEINIGIAFIKDQKLKSFAGRGFGLILENYRRSELVLNEFARRYLYDIFYREDFNIEKFLHRSFSSKSAVEKYGLNAFIGDYIKKIDEFLAEYVLARPELLKTILNDFKNAFSRWDEFVEKNSDDRINIIYEEAERYLEKNDDDIAFSYIEAVYYIAKKKGLDKLFDEYNIKKYYKGIEDCYEKTDLSIMTVYRGSFNLKELKYLKYLEDLIDRLFNERVVEEVSDNYLIEEAKPGQIFDFISSSRK